KLRKRDDHQHHHHHHHNDNTVHPEQVQVQVATHNNQQQQQQQNIVIANNNGLVGISNPAMCSSTDSVDSCSCINGNSIVVNNNNAQNNMDNGPVILENKEGQTILYATAASAEQFIWQFPPPPYPPNNNNTPPPQYTLYNDQDTLVHGLQADRQGFAKGFRKNLGGRWRRLVKKKPENETCAIPPELKDQLKTIYVY
ncbi:hypothetical protein QAD02_018957, partial [Eretmocerus hayati]